MDIEFYHQRALARLGDGRQIYDYQQRTPSNLKLLEEYLRRLRLWMERLNMPFERWWKDSDLASTLNPHIRTSKEIYQWVFEITQQRPYPYGVDELTFENMLRWETLRQHHEITETYNLPDPYEPFILLLKRGGGFFFGDEESVYSYEDETILHLTAGDISLLSRDIRWLTHDIQNLPSPETPLVSLDEDTLNAIDASTPKLYGFFPDGRANFCGQARNGDQYLIYDLYGIEHTLIMKFSASGELMEIIEKERIQGRRAMDLDVIAAQLDIREMQVTVQKFYLSQYDFGIEDTPWDDFLEDPSAFDEDEHEEIEEEIEDWLMIGKFVLKLGPGGNDYWLSREGHITAT